MQVISVLVATKTNELGDFTTYTLEVVDVIEDNNEED